MSTTRLLPVLKAVLGINAVGCGTMAWYEVCSKDRQRVARGMPVSKPWTKPVCALGTAAISPFVMVGGAVAFVTLTHVDPDWVDAIETEQERIEDLQQWP